MTREELEKALTKLAYEGRIPGAVWNQILDLAPEKEQIKESREVPDEARELAGKIFELGFTVDGLEAAASLIHQCAESRQPDLVKALDEIAHHAMIKVAADSEGVHYIDIAHGKWTVERENAPTFFKWLWPEAPELAVNPDGGTVDQTSEKDEEAEPSTTPTGVSLQVDKEREK